MDSGEIYAPRSAARMPAPPPPAPPPPPSGPPPASEPAHRQGDTSFGTPAENPFGEPSRTQRAARNTRGRVGGALAAAGALIVKFFGAIKGLILLLPKLK